MTRRGPKRLRAPVMESDEDQCLLCHRCGAVLTPGTGSFYVVRITAVADPAAPTITEADLEADLDAEIDRLLDEIRDMSERELTEQVFRRLTIHLCRRCYEQWIEDPTA